MTKRTASRRSPKRWRQRVSTVEPAAACRSRTRDADSRLGPEEIGVYELYLQLGARSCAARGRATCFGRTSGSPSTPWSCSALRRRTHLRRTSSHSSRGRQLRRLATGARRHEQVAAGLVRLIRGEGQLLTGQHDCSRADVRRSCDGRRRRCHRRAARRVHAGGVHHGAITLPSRPVPTSTLPADTCAAPASSTGRAAPREPSRSSDPATS